VLRHSVEMDVRRASWRYV